MYRTYSNQQQHYLLWQVRIAGRKFIIIYDNDKDFGSLILSDSNS